MEISYDKIKQIVSLSSDPSFIFQADNGQMKILYFSSGLASLYGFSEDEFIPFKQMDIIEILPEYEREKARRAILGLIKNDTTYRFDFVVKNKDQQFVSCKGKCFYLGEHMNRPALIAILDDESGRMTNEKLSQLFLSEKRYRTVLDFAGIFVWDMNIPEHKIYNDNGWIKEYHLENEMKNFPQSMIDSNFIDRESVDKITESYKKLLDGEKDISYEVWVRINEFSKPVCLKVRYLAEIPDAPDKKPVHAYAYALNITDLKTAENTFNSRTSAYLRMNPNAIFTMQANLTQNTISNIVLKKNELSDFNSLQSYDDMVSEFIKKIYDKNERIKFINTFSKGTLIAAYNSGNFTITYEHRLKFSENDFKWVRTLVDMVKNPITGDIEAVIHLITIQSMKVLNMLAQGTVNKSYDFVAIINKNKDAFYLVSKNSQFDHSEIKGFDQYFFDFFNKLINDNLERQVFFNQFSLNKIYSHLQTENEFTIEFSTDNNIDSHRKQLSFLSLPDFEESVFLMTCRDITRQYNNELAQKNELKEALLKAREANAAKTNFLSLVSHDIRTPLNGIIGMNELALNEDISDKVRCYLEKAQLSSEFLLGLINDILDLTKIESGKLELIEEKYTYSEFINYITAVMNPLCEKKDITFNLNIEKNADAIITDKLRFNQVFFNILSNAVKYTPAGGTVSFSSELLKKENGIITSVYYIKDNGIGMSKSFMAHLFDEFSQENRVSSSQVLGTGLGLSIVKKLVDLMHGEIEVDSKVNEGTTFKLTLSYKELTEDDLGKLLPDEDLFKKPEVNGKNILLVEDNEINQEIAKELLFSLGANVDVANNGEEGVKLFKENDDNHYDLILMDVRMPIMNGHEATKLIRNHSQYKYSSAIPIVAMTANAMVEDKSECLNSGMNDFLAKPINKKALYQMLNIYIK